MKKIAAILLLVLVIATSCNQDVFYEKIDKIPNDT